MSTLEYVFLRFLITASIVVACFFTDVADASAKEQLFEADGSCIVGNTGVEDIELAKNKAKDRALSKALEEAGVLIVSTTEMKNNSITKDEVKIFAKKHARIESSPSQEFIPNEDAIKYMCHVKVWVDTDEVVKDIPNTSLEKIADQVKMDKDRELYDAKNETEIADLRQQYKNANDDAKRQEIATAIKRNETKFTAAQIYQQGVDSYNKGKLAEAAKFYNQAISMDSQYAAPLTGLGWIYNDQEQYAKAIECFQKSISLYGDLAVPYNGLSYAYNFSKDFNKAIEYGNKAVQLDSRYAAAWNNIGLAYNNSGNYGKAIEYYNKAIAIAPNDEIPLVNIGNVYYRQKDFSKAMEYYQKSIKINSNHSNVWYNVGNIYGQNSDLGKALESYKKATSIDPKNVRAWVTAGIVNNKLENFDEAKSCFKKALKLNPNISQAWDGLGYACDKLGDYSGAYEAYQKAVELEPNNERFKTNRDTVKSKIG